MEYWKHVDDFLFFGSTMFQRDVIKTVQKSFKNSAEVSNNLKYFGILVSQNNNGIKIGQNDYIENLTILKGSRVLFNSVQEWLVGCF